MRPEKIARPHDQAAPAIQGRGLQHGFHLHADFSLSCQRILRGVFRQDGAGIRTEIIDIAGQDEPRTGCFRRGDRMPQHRDGEATPVLVTWRIGAVKDDFGTTRRCHDIRLAHGIAGDRFKIADPGHAARRLVRIARQGRNPPAIREQSAGDLSADAAGGADNEGFGFCRHPEICPVHQDLLCWVGGGIQPAEINEIG